MKNEQKTFAFKLAEKKRKDANPRDTKWKARDGLSLAGCTDPSGQGNYRYGDTGVWC